MKIVLATLLVAASSCAFAQTYVRPHVRADGTFVQGHMRSSPNSTKIDNWSSTGQTNPFTGSQGTSNPYNPPQPRY